MAHAPRPTLQGGESRSPLRAPTRLIGDIVVDLGYAEHEQVQHAVERARAEGKLTGQMLVEEGVIRHDQLARAIAQRLHFDYIDLASQELDMEAVGLLDVEAIRRYQAVPVAFLDDGALLLAMSDPTNVLTIDDIAMITGRRVRAAVASAEDVQMLVARLSRSTHAVQEIIAGEDDASEPQLANVAPDGSDAPVVRFVHALIAEAAERGASDVHIDPEESQMRVSFRVDGVVTPAATLSRRKAAGVISRVKVMAEMDISERRAPQDGRFALNVEGRRVDVRVVTLPLVHGEGAYMRILDKSIAVKTLEDLGMRAKEHERVAGAIARPHGAVLVTGPTGNGKSTTLYAALKAINDGSRSLLTIEDPVESRLHGVRQMQIAPKAGVTFASGLRSMLRADPDVIMVGEIRDRETAQIAIEAALTGHLVLSTLHTRDAPGALGRLIDMGIEPFLVASAIDCVVAQRLVRLLCQHCKQPTQASEQVLELHGLDRDGVYDPAGCERCGSTGYRGRIGLYEVMSVGEEIRALVLDRAPTDQIAAVAERHGMRRMREDGIARVRDGLTSLAEVQRMAASLL
ncbi:MAG: GspE/PulE family protein [Solirubrobacteraceae bacterium]